MTWKRAFLIAMAGVGCGLLSLGVEALRFVGLPQAAWGTVPEYLQFRWVWGMGWTVFATAATILIAMLVWRWGQKGALISGSVYVFLSAAASTAALALWMNAVETQVQPAAQGGYVSLSIGLFLPVIACASLICFIVSAAVSRTRWKRRLAQPDHGNAG